MASVTAFNDMMGQFLVELHKTFPEEKGLKRSLESVQRGLKPSLKSVQKGFIKLVDKRTRCCQA